jgi:hypothetical protein
VSTRKSVDPSAAWGDHVLVSCPRCDRRATADARAPGDRALRLTCSHRGYTAATSWPARSFQERPDALLAAYHEGNFPFGAPLWLEPNAAAGIVSGR